MRGKRFTEEKIIGILKEHEAGVAANELGRKYGISSTTIYNWKAKYAGLTVSEARRLKVLEDTLCLMPYAFFILPGRLS